MGKRMDEVLQKLIDVNNSVTFVGALFDMNLEKGNSAMKKDDVITAIHYYGECKNSLRKRKNSRNKLRFSKWNL